MSGFPCGSCIPAAGGDGAGEPRRAREDMTLLSKVEKSLACSTLSDLSDQWARLRLRRAQSGGHHGRSRRWGHRSDTLARGDGHHLGRRGGCYGPVLCVDNLRSSCIGRLEE